MKWPAGGKKRNEMAGRRKKNIYIYIYIYNYIYICPDGGKKKRNEEHGFNTFPTPEDSIHLPTPGTPFPGTPFQEPRSPEDSEQPISSQASSPPAPPHPPSVYTPPGVTYGRIKTKTKAKARTMTTAMTRKVKMSATAFSSISESSEKRRETCRGEQGRGVAASKEPCLREEVEDREDDEPDHEAREGRRPLCHVVDGVGRSEQVHLGVSARGAAARPAGRTRDGLSGHIAAALR